MSLTKLTRVNESVIGLKNAERALLGVSARMAAGESVTFVVYGDSTDDGFATTGWVKNHTAGGEAVGNVNHNLDAPNSWSVQLELLLREMYKNQNIKVNNAGYAGQSMADGWALRNYETAVINNPFYGVPDVVLLGFGLNDIRPAGSQIDDFITQLTKLSRKIASYGSVPVIVTPDPIMRNYGATNAIYNKEVSGEMVPAMKYMAKRLMLPLIDKHTKLRDWANNNRDGRRWFVEQSTDVNGDGIYSSGDDVGLHFRDLGHRVKAQIVASYLYADTIISNGKTQRITSNDSRASCFGNFLTTLNGTGGPNNDQGFAFKVNYKDTQAVHKPTGPRFPLATLWVWNEDPDCTVVYRGLVGEGWGTNSPDTPINNPLPPAVVITDKTGGTVTTRVPSAVGYRYSGFYKPSDVPYVVGKLPYGLSRIEYQCGDLSHYNDGSNTLMFYGSFDLVHNNKLSVQPYTAVIPAGATTLNVDQSMDVDAVFGLMDKDKVEVLIDASLPIGCGVVIGHTNTFGNISASIADGYGSKLATVLYRHDATRVRIGLAKVGAITGDIIKFPRTVAAAVTFTGERSQVKIVMSRSYVTGDFGSGAQSIELYDGWAANTPVQTTTIPSTDSPLCFGGAVGGTYSDGALNVTGGTICLHSMAVSQKQIGL